MALYLGLGLSPYGWRPRAIPVGVGWSREQAVSRLGVLVPPGSGRLVRLARQSSLPATVRPGIEGGSTGGRVSALAHALAPRVVPLRDRQSVRVRRLRARVGIITVAATRCSPRRAVVVAVFAPERRGGTNEIAVSDTAVHTNRSAG